MLSGGRAVVAGLTTSLVDVASGSRLARWAAHSAAVVVLAVPASESCLISAGEGERSAAVHSLAFGKKGKLVRKAACATLSLRSAATTVSVLDTKEEGNIAVAVVLKDGGLELFVAPTGAKSKDTPAAQAKRVAVAAPGSNVLAADVQRADKGSATLLVATGTPVRPLFQTVVVEYTQDDATPAVIELTSEQGGGPLLGSDALAAAGRKKKAGANVALAVVGADEVVRAGIADNNATTGVSTSAKKRGAAEEEEEDVNPTVDELPEITESAEEGPTLGDRVAALQKLAGGRGGRPSASNDVGPRISKQPSAASLATLLTQALRSDDKSLLERCLAVRKERVIGATTRAITGADAALLLRALVARLGASPLRGATLAAWTRATLRAHAGALAATPGAAGTLGALGQQIEMRLAGHQQLLSLAGRLDLVLAQMAGGEGKNGTRAAEQAPVRVDLGQDGTVAVEEVNGVAEDYDLETDRYHDGGLFH